MRHSTAQPQFVDEASKLGSVGFIFGAIEMNLPSGKALGNICKCPYERVLLLLLKGDACHA